MSQQEQDRPATSVALASDGPLDPSGRHPLSPGVYLFRDDDSGGIFHLAEVHVDPEQEVVTLHFLQSRDEARDVYRAVGGDLAQLEALFAAGSDSKRPGRTRSAKSGRPSP
jgi:hypothetical protein